MSTKRPAVDFSVVGATGLKHSGGMVLEEFLPELKGSRGRDVFRQMAELDPVVGAILFAVECLIRQVDWSVEPFSDSAQDTEDAQFVEGCMHDMELSWPDTLAEILTMVPYGWSMMELVFKRREGMGDDPESSSFYDDGKIGWRIWSPRAQDTLWRWQFNENGRVLAMEQMAPPDYQVRILPREKCLHFVTSSRKLNPEGRSLLRNAYQPWYFRTNIERIEGIGVERDLAGLPMAWVPPGLVKPSVDQTPEEKASATYVKKLLANIKRDEQEGIMWPLSYDGQGNKEWDLTLLSTGGQRQFDTSGIITRYNQAIAQSLLADFILLGHEAVGSFALADAKTELFSVALGALLDVVTSEINRRAIPKLYRLNGMDTQRMCKLVHGDVESVDMEKLANSLPALISAGVVNPDGKLEAWVRATGGMPEVDPEAARAREEEKMAELARGGIADEMARAEAEASRLDVQSRRDWQAENPAWPWGKVPPDVEAAARAKAAPGRR